MSDDESFIERLMATNSVSAQQVRSQLAAAISGGYDYADTLHNIYLDFGYPARLDFFNYWNMYRRFGIARRGVDLIADQTWLDTPEIISSEQFVRDLDVLIDKFGLWRRLNALDRRQRVGRYAGLFVRVRDGLKPSEPIAGKLNGLASLVELRPLYESQLRVVEIDNDAASDTFGLPLMYQFSSSAAGNRNEQSGTSFNIHPSRVIISAEGADDSGIYGVSSLESVYNSLLDLRKILGAGGEGFYRNAAQSTVFNLTEGASAKTDPALLDKFNEMYDDFVRNRQRRAMWTPGMEAKTLESNLTNPKEFAMNALMDVAAGFNIPLNLLIGNQTGRLAGDQDTRGFLGDVNTRRGNYGTDTIRVVLNWFIRWGILPQAEFIVEDWPDALAPSMSERLDNADKMASINQKQFLSGGQTPYTSDEIREESGFEAEEIDELPDETLIDELGDGQED